MQLGGFLCTKQSFQWDWPELCAYWLLPAPTQRATQEKKEKANVKKEEIGKTEDGVVVDQYTLTNAHGMKAKIITYGGIITELDVPDRDGKMGDVVLGFDNLKSYLASSPYFGATVGRVANRIAKGRFTLDGKEYKLSVNNGPNSLHGGQKGFDKVVWKAEPSRDDGRRRAQAHATTARTARKAIPAI